MSIQQTALMHEGKFPLQTMLSDISGVAISTAFARVCPRYLSDRALPRLSFGSNSSSCTWSELRTGRLARHCKYVKHIVGDEGNRSETTRSHNVQPNASLFLDFLCPVPSGYRTITPIYDSS